MDRKRVIWSVFYRDDSFRALGNNWSVESVQSTQEFNPIKGDIVVILGGGDISPQLYGHGYMDRTGKSSPRMNHGHYPPRDELEMEVCLEAIDRGIPIIGCCRGAQMLCIAAGGTLVQDTTNHLGSHPLVIDPEDRHLFPGDEEPYANSIHHQMMRYSGVPHKLIAWTPHRSGHYHAEGGFDVAKEFPLGEPEIVWYPVIKGLGFQYHPENNINAPYGKFAVNLVRKYLLQENQL